MNKKIFEKYFIASIIGILLFSMVGIFKYDLLIAASTPNADYDYNFQNKIDSIENSYQNGLITKSEYDSLSNYYSLMLQKTKILNSEENYIPNWLQKTNFLPPVGLKYEPYFSDFTTSENGNFNSVQLVYTGSYDSAFIYTQYLVDLFKLKMITFTKSEKTAQLSPIIRFANYDLTTKNNDLDYFYSVTLTNTGKITFSATDIKQLNKLLAKKS